jgi:hypothetical protein
MVATRESGVFREFLFNCIDNRKSHMHDSIMSCKRCLHSLYMHAHFLRTACVSHVNSVQCLQSNILDYFSRTLRPASIISAMMHLQKVETVSLPFPLKFIEVKLLCKVMHAECARLQFLSLQLLTKGRLEVSLLYFVGFCDI